MVLAVGAAAIPTVRLHSQDEVPTFALKTGDVAELHDLGGRLHIRLGGPARARFARFTAAHIGLLVRVTAGGTVLNEAVVRLEIDSGLLSSRRLDEGPGARCGNY